MSRRPHRFRGPLEQGSDWPGVNPAEEPPADSGERQTDWMTDRDSATRDTTPAVGSRAEPWWGEAGADAEVPLARPDFDDSRWSYLFKRDTSYADVEPRPGEVAAAARRMRGESALPASVQGPFIKPPVWTWEVPLYFWVGGVASGAGFVGLACDVAGDHRSAAIARRVALGAVSVAPPLLIADLGRPGRFLNMLRIVKPRSPMNLGAWCLIAFSATDAAAVAADLVGLRRSARVLGGVTALLGGYLGSYTGVLLASTAVPLWARSRLFLGPIFVTTATATGAAATRLVLSARGLPCGHPTRNALGTLEAGAIVVETALTEINHRRLGRAGEVTREGRAGLLFRLAQGSVGAGVLLRFGRRSDRGPAHHLGSVLYLAGGLLFRFAWVEAGKASARDHETVARAARGIVTQADERMPAAVAPRVRSLERRPLPLRRVRRVYGEAVRRVSLTVEGMVRRG